MGFTAGTAHAQPLTTMTAPPSFATADDLGKKIAELAAAHPGQQLYAVHKATNGLELIMKAPASEVWGAATVASRAAINDGAGLMTCVLDYARDHVVWSPRPFDQYIDECPGRACDVVNPFFEMGGSGASSAASFL